MAAYFVTTPTMAASDGVTASDANNGTSTATPWLTIGKVNGFAFNPGDTVSFRRGGVWSGVALTIGRNGASGNLLLYTAYGTGAKPIINGFVTISSGSWVATAGMTGVYQVTVPGSIPRVTEVTLDGSHMDMIKYPRTNTGYIRVTTGDTSANITGGAGANLFITNTGNSAQMPTLLSAVPNCIDGSGAGEVCWRPRHWVNFRGRLVTQTTTQITFDATQFPTTSGGPWYGAQSDGAKPGYGFFIQNHKNLLVAGTGVQVGDWAYHPSTHILYMYFGPAGPSGHTVEASSMTDTVVISGHSFVKIDNMSIRGANNALFNIVNSPNITVNACDLYGAGIYGAFGNGSTTALTFTNNVIDRVHSNGMRAAASATGWIITDNIFTNTGATAGMGGDGEGQYFGLRDIKGASQILRNRIINTGLNPINFQGINNLIQDNLVDTFCTVKDDGGGIYWGGTNTFSGSVVDHNICINGIGVTQGTPDTGDARAHGIYMDDGASGATVTFNTCAFNGNAGINLHSAPNNNMHDNTCYANKQNQIKYYNGAPSTDLMGAESFNNNIMVAQQAPQIVLVSSGGSTSTASWFTAANTNVWTRPCCAAGSENNIFSTPQGNFNLGGWKTFLNKEAASASSPLQITNVNDYRFEYNDTNSPKVVTLGANYIDMRNVSYPGTITLQPWTSAVLLRTGAITATPAQGVSFIYG